MNKTLIIAEKPSVARDIAKALGGFAKTQEWLESKTTIVTSGIGHLVELHVEQAGTSGKTLATLPIIPKVFGRKVSERTKSQFAIVKKLLSRADVDCVVNACDAGREGELIFRLIYEASGCTKPHKRMWLQSMTDQAILEAHKGMRPGSDFDHLSDAAKCRSEADWLIGINGSRGISRLYEATERRFEIMSAGRVQTPTLAILVHREQEIANFVPRDYWELHASFDAQSGSYSARWYNPKSNAEREDHEGQNDGAANGFQFHDKAAAQAVLQKCKGVTPSRVSDEQKKVLSHAPRLYDLTTLQRDANKVLKFSAQKTLDLAQALYEKHKAISYPRTDASALPEDYVEKARQVMTALQFHLEIQPHCAHVLSQGWIKPDKKIFDNSKISDHFAIIPTGSRSSTMTQDESSLFDMIAKRFVAAFFPAAEYSNTIRTTVVSGEIFRSTGKVLLKEGWRVVYGKIKEDSKTPALCALKPGEIPKPGSMSLKAMKTKPPARFTEAMLLAAMETAGKLVEDDELKEAMKERGLGTPATRAATIEGLLKNTDSRGKPKEPYVRREGKEQNLVPTPKGMNLVEFLEGNGIEALTQPRMTGEWEQKLALMEKGKYPRGQFMAEISAMTVQIIEIMRAKAGVAAQAEHEKQTIHHPCPSCAGELEDRAQSVVCKAGCGFQLWREVAGRVLSGQEIDQLLTDGKTDHLDGFMSKSRKAFSTALVMDKKGKISFDFGTQPIPDSSQTLQVNCPKCKGSVSLTGGKYPQYVCAAGDFKIWQNIAQRPLSTEELQTLLKVGRTEVLDGFVSGKTGRAFSAALSLSKDMGKVDFIFERV